MWQCVFVFLPLMVAYNASQKIGADPWVGFAIMAVLMLPGFAGSARRAAVDVPRLAGHDVQIFGVPLTIFDYSSQVFPPLLMAAVLGPLYKGLKKVIPENIQLIFVPFLAMLIMIPLTAFLIGPIGVYAGAALANLLARSTRSRRSSSRSSSRSPTRSWCRWACTGRSTRSCC
jgi:PTS system beta-glucosides-specific IIC component